LVIGSGAASYGLIRLLTYFFAIDTMIAKISAESFLFIVNFILQRDFVFTRRARASLTDWTRYYRSVPFTARLTRKYTAGVLVAALRQVHRGPGGEVIIELGGANSCFVDRIVRELRPAAYHVVDNNEHGLSMLRARSDRPPEVRLHRGDVLDMHLDIRADAVFSVGLIEHFDPQGTRKAVLKHFELLRPGGYAILSFPTPTALYRAARAVAEFFGFWHLPDERPLRRSEIADSIEPLGEIVLEKTLWPLVYTQHLMVIRKRELAHGAAASA
jgi:SAM-dependent methyltransferase